LSNAVFGADIRTESKMFSPAFKKEMTVIANPLSMNGDVTILTEDVRIEVANKKITAIGHPLTGKPIPEIKLEKREFSFLAGKTITAKKEISIDFNISHFLGKVDQANDATYKIKTAKAGHAAAMTEYFDSMDPRLGSIHTQKNPTFNESKSQADPQSIKDIGMSKDATFVANVAARKANDSAHALAQASSQMEEIAAHNAQIAAQKALKTEGIDSKEYKSSLDKYEQARKQAHAKYTSTYKQEYNTILDQRINVAATETKVKKEIGQNRSKIYDALKVDKVESLKQRSQYADTIAENIGKFNPDERAKILDTAAYDLRAATKMAKAGPSKGKK
jgi:hypothetical protein